MTYDNKRRERRHEAWEKQQWEKSHNMPEVRKRRKTLFIIAIVILAFVCLLSLANPVTWVILRISLLVPIISGKDK